MVLLLAMLVPLSPVALRSRSCPPLKSSGVVRWDYSWDIMEPVTYFITYGTACGMYAYWLVTRREYDYEVRGRGGGRGRRRRLLLSCEPRVMLTLL